MVERSDTTGYERLIDELDPVGVVASMKPLRVHPTGVGGIYGLFSGGIAALNHRLIASTPPGSESPLARAFAPQSLDNPRQLRLLIGLQRPRRRMCRSCGPGSRRRRRSTRPA